jgi:hypothetical protein
VSGVYRQCPKSTDSVRSLQAVSEVYRQFWSLHFTGSVQSLPAVSGAYRQCTEFTGSVRSLQAVSRVYRQCPEFTGSVRSLQTVSGVYRQCPEITGSVRSRVCRSYSLKAKISENLGIFVLALKRKKCVFSLCSHGSGTFQTAKKIKAN